MKLEIENDFRQKIMTMSFAEQALVDSKASLDAWKQAWLKELSSWHSPYKLLLNCESLKISAWDNVEKDLELFFKFFKGFFLRKVVAYNTEHLEFSELPVDGIAKDFDEACDKIGVRVKKASADPTDFRGKIHIENDFRAHVMELTFTTEAAVESLEHVEIIKSKITNNLMQWHSKWNLLIDCHNLAWKEGFEEEFSRMEKHFSGLFMTTLIGYSPLSADQKYPFKVYRSRHKAVTQLERIGALSGNEAHCQSTKKPG
jgi:hypothetical protein